jgi:hypothetical protein
MDTWATHRGVAGAGAASTPGTARRLDRRSGQMVIFVTLSLSVLISLIGLAVDLGFSYFVKVNAQAAADAAAQAAAIYANKNGYVCGSGVTCGTTYSCASSPTSPPTDPLTAGCLYAKANGFLNTGGQSVSLIANSTASPNGESMSPALWIQANVSQTVTPLFLYWAGFTSGTSAAHAIGGVTVTPNSSCVYVLDSGNTSGALTISGAGALTASGCAVSVNSSNAGAITITGGGSARLNASAIKVKGGTSPSPCAAECSIAPTTGSAVASDPFGSLPAPSVPNSCYKTGYSLGNSNTDTIKPSTDPSSGVFCGGITVAGSAVLTMEPGIYYLNGGGFTNSHSGKIIGSGVTIYLTGQYGQTNAPMQLIGNSVTDLSAPNSGTYQGVLFYQDRSAAYAGQNTIGNSATLSSTGTFYFPTTGLTMSGAVGASKIGLVVKDLTLSGSATFNQDLTGTYTGLASRNPGLIQ